MTILIDSHAHLTAPELLPDVEAILERAKQKNIRIIVNICTDVISLETGLLLHERHPWVYTTAAVTPHDAGTSSEKFFSFVEKMAREGKLIAIGETGLDYYYRPEAIEVQKQSLLQHLHLARECQLPVIFHCRDAFADLFACADEHYADLPAVLHCFTGTLSEAKGVISRGWYLSFSGIITFKNANVLREVVREMPLQQILIETDAPYLAPQTKRGKRNESSYIWETAECIARIKGISVEKVMAETSKNAEDFFRFSTQ